MTIATKDAFAALNQMFKVRGGLGVRGRPRLWLAPVVGGGVVSSERCMQGSTPFSQNISCLPFCRARCRWSTAACPPTRMPSPR